MTGTVNRSLADGVFTITLVDEENRNALSAPLLRELIEAIDEAEGRADTRVVVVTNRGPVFSAGADLRERSSGGATGTTRLMTDLFRRIIASPKPFVGRIAGHAIAGGMGLAAAMDISIAAEDARMGFTEVRVGVAPAVIAVVCLPKMPRAEAAAAFLGGRRFLAPEAARLGLINEAVPGGELDTRVREVVDDLMLGGPAALAACKQLVANVPSMSFDEALAWAGDLSAALFAGPEAAEGMSAFLEKRPPAWAPRGGSD